MFTFSWLIKGLGEALSNIYRASRDTKEEGAASRFCFVKFL